MNLELNELEIATCISGILHIIRASASIDDTEWYRIILLHEKLAKALSEELSNDTAGWTGRQA